MTALGARFILAAVALCALTLTGAMLKPKRQKITQTNVLRINASMVALPVWCYIARKNAGWK
jgi:outer membrane murein-binding lipoprotein Lpp